jgi:hypothetical protein
LILVIFGIASWVFAHTALSLWSSQSLPLK